MGVTSLSDFGGGAALQRMEDAFKNQATVGAAEQCFTGALRVRHESGDVTALVADAGDVLDRTIGIRLVGQLTLGVGVLPEIWRFALSFAMVSVSAK